MKEISDILLGPTYINGFFSCTASYVHATDLMIDCIMKYVLAINLGPFSLFTGLKCILLFSLCSFTKKYVWTAFRHTKHRLKWSFNVYKPSPAFVFFLVTCSMHFMLLFWIYTYVFYTTRVHIHCFCVHTLLFVVIYFA